MFDEIDDLEPTDESHASEPDRTEVSRNLSEEAEPEELPF
jgi:hypothetical protein